MSEEHGPDIVKWYTRARKFPQLIGRTPDGAKIPGGPYTVTQAVAAGLILVIGLNTMSIWAQFGLLGNLLVLATVTWTVVWSLGRIPVGSRNPLSVATGLAHAVAAPATGRLGGRAVRIRRPRQLRHSVVLALTDHAAPTSRAVDKTDPVLAADAAPAEASAPRGRHRPRRPRRPRATTATPVLPAAPQLAPMDLPPLSAPAASQGPRRAPLTGVQALLAANQPLPRHGDPPLTSSRGLKSGDSNYLRPKGGERVEVHAS